MRKLTDATPQQRNLNRHTSRGMKALEESIQQDGWIGAITVAADGETFDGSARVETGVSAGFDEAIVVESDGSRPVIVRRTDIPTATDPRAVRLGIAANRVAELNLDWNVQELAALAQETDLSQLFTGDELPALLEQAGSELLEGASNQIVGHSQGYDFREIHAGKLGYRIEAAWRSNGALAIDLYSGQGQLAEWYSRRFDRVIRIDQEPNEGLDYVASAVDWLRSADFAAVADTFDFIDFDDEGSPLRAVKTLFEVLPRRDRPFVLCVTDGSGLNLKLHGQFNPALYGLEGVQRRATTEDYGQFDDLVRGAINAFASSGGYTAQQWSSVRGSEGNVVYQTYLINSEQG